MGGPDRRVRVGLDPGSHAHEHPPHVCRGRPRHLVLRIQDDEARLCGGGRLELFVALVVSVHDDALAGDAGA